MDEPEGNVDRIPLVYILGSGHCGSTLLNLLLNAHPSMVGLSELVSIQNHLCPGHDDVITESELWARIRERYENIAPQPARFHEIDLSTPSLLQIMSKRLPSRWIVNNYYLMRSVLDVTKKDIAVDASKGVRRLLGLHKTGLYEFRVIHLVRNGRAVVHSYRKKGYSFLSSFRRWFIPAVFTRRVMSSKLKSVTLTIRYEDLCDDPEGVLKDLCNHIGLPYTNRMLDYRGVPYIGVGGNRMGTNQRNTEIRRDESWRSECNPADDVLFRLFLGVWVNSWYGYNEVEKSSGTGTFGKL